MYIIIGVFFGVFDFYYQSLMQKSFDSSLFRLILILGIWLLPVVPIAVHETKISYSRVRSALACILTWCASIISYYLFYAVQLAFFSSPTRQVLHISNHGESYFWRNWKSVFWHDIFLRGIVEWSVVAVIGGFIVGFLISLTYLHLKNHNFKKPEQKI